MSIKCIVNPDLKISLMHFVRPSFFFFQFGQALQTSNSIDASILRSLGFILSLFPDQFLHCTLFRRL